jgi:hypothetical protein
LRDPATQFYGARPTFFRHPLCLTSQGSGSQRFATRGLSAQGFYAHDPERNLARRSQRSLRRQVALSLPCSHRPQRAPT